MKCTKPCENNQFMALLSITTALCCNTHKEINGCWLMAANSNLTERNRTRRFTGSYKLPIVSKAIGFLSSPKHYHYKAHLPPQTIRVTSPPFHLLEPTCSPYPVFAKRYLEKCKLKISVLWDVMACSLVTTYQHFRVALLPSSSG